MDRRSESAIALPPLPAEDLIHVLAHTSDLWEELRGQSIFITGGTGFFGIWLLESFAFANDQLGLGARVAVLSRDPKKFAARLPHLANRIDISFIAGDVRNFEFPPGSYSFVIHGGASPAGNLEPLEMFETIVDGARRVLDFAANHGTRKFLFVSSGAVYGTQPSDLIHLPESHTGAPDPLKPGSAYGEGKRAAEFLCSEVAEKRGFEVTIARGFAFVGPHLPLDAQFAMGNFMRDALRRGPIHIAGDGTAYRSYLHTADMTICLWSILFRGRSHTAYNVGSQKGLPLLEVARHVAAAFDPQPEVKVANPGIPGLNPHRYVPSMSRAREHLGFVQRIDLPDAILRTVNWHRQISQPPPPG